MNLANRNRTKQMLISSVLIALGILIPMIMPIKIIIGPASYTLASHVPIFIGLMISPFVAISVTAGTTIGFLLSGFPPVIVLRAGSHFLFVLVALLLIKYFRYHRMDLKAQLPYLVIINFIHALGEVIAVYLFSVTAQTTNTEGFYYTLWVLVGLGTFIHGMIDYYLAYLFASRIKLSTLVKGIQYDN